MKFLADENLGIKVPQYLQKQGFDIQRVNRVQIGKFDKDILEFAKLQKRILITSDKDFARLIIKEKLTTYGVMLLNLKNESMDNKKKVLLKALKSKQKFENKLTELKD